MVSHDWSKDGEDIAKGSVMESSPLGQWWVGLETTCDKPKEVKMLHSLL